MRLFGFTFLTLLVSAVSAINIAGLPKCAGECLGTHFGGCKQTQVNCICSNKPFIAKLSCCVKKKCDKKDQETTLKFAQAICKGAKVNDLPKSASCDKNANLAASPTPGSSSSSSSMNAAPTHFLDAAGLGLMAAGLMVNL